MKKVLFIDHAFHRKTRSSDFFIDIVRQGFEVEVYHLTPEASADAAMLPAAEAADVILLWQLDFLAPLFLAMGKPTIVIPMYDGSAQLPDLHWVFASGARFLNFSLALNERVRILGGETMLLRYFPSPAAENDLPRFDRFNAFFWQRRPDHGVDFDLVNHLIGSELDHFHLHNVPDVPGDFHFQIPNDAPYQFNESTWFESKSDYEECLKSSNIFIAPRASEGIGLALLEAMARGMLVLAHDAPTNSEYISNFLNGILFNKDVRQEPIKIRSQAASMGRMAWNTVVDGHREWTASHPAILAWIDGAKERPAIAFDRETLFRDLWHSYYGSLPEYERFLQRHLGLLDNISALPLEALLSLVGEVPEPRDDRGQSRRRLIDASGILDLTAGDGHVGSGWSGAEAEWRWAIGKQSELFFSIPESDAERYRVRFEASALPELGRGVACSIALNGHRMFNGRIKPEWSEHQFSFDADILDTENRLELEFDRSGSTASDKRDLAVCFKPFRFSKESSVGQRDAERTSTLWPPIQALPLLRRWFGRIQGN